MRKLKLTHKLTSIWDSNIHEGGKRLSFIIHDNTFNCLNFEKLKEKKLETLTTNILKSDIPIILNTHGK